MGLACRSGSNAVLPDGDGSPRGSDSKSGAHGIDADPSFAYDIRYEVEAPRALGITFGDALVEDADTGVVPAGTWTRTFGTNDDHLQLLVRARCEGGCDDVTARIFVNGNACAAFQGPSFLGSESVEILGPVHRFIQYCGRLPADCFPFRVYAYPDNPRPTPAPAGGIYWSSDFETGDLSQWSAGQGGFAESNTEQGDAVVSSEASHRGARSAKLTVAGIDRVLTATRLIRFAEFLSDAYLSAWIMFPTLPAIGHGWLDIFQVKKRRTCGASTGPAGVLDRDRACVLDNR